MKLLLVSKLDRCARAVRAITKYVETGKALGHDVAMFGEQDPDFSWIPYSLDVTSFDYVVFVVYESWDFPDLPYLARLLDGVPKSRRVIIDCTGRCNETIRVDHDFNHLERLDGHQGWEWVEALRAVSDKVLQPTLKPLDKNVQSFLFFAYDPAAVKTNYASAQEAAKAWSEGKQYGVAYVGSNWMRWLQMKAFLEAVEPIKDALGQIAIRGWSWDQRPEWAAQQGLVGVDLDQELMKRLGVDVGCPIGFDEVVDFQSKAKFCPVFHRPIYKHLGLTTNRAFETFASDTMPLLMLPSDQVETIHGKAALPLVPGNDVAGRMRDMVARPAFYWDAVLKTREHLAKNHSYGRRFQELVSILES